METNTTNIYRLLRIAKGKTVPELAKELEVTPAYVYGIEKGIKNPSKRLTRDYARVLEVDEEIFETFNNEKPQGPFEKLLLWVLKQICKTED